MLRRLLAIDVVISRFFDRVARNPIRWTIGALIGGVVFGGVSFSLIEPDQSIPDGLWWAVVTMSTVGYGDLAPHSTSERFLTVFVICDGLGSIAILTAILSGRITKQQMRPDYSNTPEIHDDLEAVIHRLGQDIEDLERLLPVVSHPLVVAALTEVITERTEAT